LLVPQNLSEYIAVTLPPDNTTPTRRQFAEALRKTAAAAAAPDGSTTIFILNKMNFIVAMISSSVTVRTASAF